MFEKVVKIIKEQLNMENAEIGMETSFKEDLDVDSLDLFELVKITTVGAVVEYLKDKGAE